jgi:hypothetical protein
VIHELLLFAVQTQPVPAVTLTVPVPPDGEWFLLVGLMV